eukprot:symbB.v1.2.013380.t1/scaffold947.1/size149738/5
MCRAVLATESAWLVLTDFSRCVPSGCWWQLGHWCIAGRVVSCADHAGLRFHSKGLHFKRAEAASWTRVNRCHSRVNRLSHKLLQACRSEALAPLGI